METKEIATVMDAALVAPSKETAVQIFHAIMAAAEHVNPIEAAVQLTCLYKGVEMALKQIRDTDASECMRSAIADGASKTQTVLGAKVTLKETGVKYDYSVYYNKQGKLMKNKKWERLNAKVSAAKDELKKLEATLQIEGKYDKFSTETISISLG